MEDKKANIGWFDDPEKNNERHALVHTDGPLWLDAEVFLATGSICMPSRVSTAYLEFFVPSLH